MFAIDTVLCYGYEKKDKGDDVVKKWLALLLALTLTLIPAFALAEAAADEAYAAYSNETNGYTIDYPDDWTLVSKESLQSVLDALDSGETVVDGLDSSTIKACQSQIENMDMVMFISPDGVVNANVTYQAVSGKVTSDEILSHVCPLVKQQFESAYQGYAELTDPAVQTVGDNEFVETAGQYTLSDQSFIILQALCSSDSALYTVTYVINNSMDPDADAIDAITTQMLASFTPA